MNKSTDDQKPLTAQSFEPAVISPTAFTPSNGKQRRKSLTVKPVSIILGLFLLLGAATVWFLFTAKSVIVNTLPHTTDFTITGGLKVEFSGHYIMREGAYVFEATQPGYHPLKETILVDDNQNQIKTFEFKKLPGRLSVKAKDDTTADIVASVWIDGQHIGDTNKELANISAGEHQIKIRSERYFEHSQTIEIMGMDKLQNLSVSLKPAWANISLLSEPAGAQLSSNGKVVGQTPFNGTLIRGERQLTLSLPGYQNWQNDLKVEAGVDVDLTRVYLQRIDGTLQLSAKPQVVSVTLDGKYLGVTPINLPLSANQNHTLSFFKDGYQQQQQQIKVSPGQTRELVVTLKAQLGQITIHANHEDALLYVDDRLMGRANQSVTLTAKQHKVVIKKEGHVNFETTVLPRADMQQIVDVRLRTVEQAKWDNVKERITTRLGSTLKLFKPKDVFSMGASRREQGRRSNEVSRRISLERPFYLAIKEVKNSEFHKFSKSHSSGHVKGNSLNSASHPVVNVSWKQAVLFCNWLSAKDKLPPFYKFDADEFTGINPDATGYRLPTEAEWAWITRYKNGQMLKYSWGSKLPPMPNSGNFADRSGASILGFIQATYNDKYVVTSPVGSYPANDRGIYDLSGNVAEWVHDFYEVKTGLSVKIEHDPLGVDKGDYHVIRGSSWAHGTMTELRLSFRDYGAEPRNDVGFRIARFVDVAGATDE
jgi:formylglycine-generating enzyme required for sulfatase activity